MGIVSGDVTLLLSLNRYVQIQRDYFYHSFEITKTRINNGIPKIQDAISKIRKPLFFDGFHFRSNASFYDRKKHVSPFLNPITPTADRGLKGRMGGGRRSAWKMVLDGVIT